MKKLNQKGFAPLVMVIIVIAVLAVGSYFVLKTRVAVAPTQSPFPTGIVTSTPDETAGWKTYTNTQYRFEFTYDPKVYALEKDLNSYFGKNGEKILVDLYEIKSKATPTEYGYNHFAIWVAPNSNKLSSVAYAEKYFSEDLQGAKFKVSGYDAIELGELDSHIVVIKGDLAFDIIDRFFNTTTLTSGILSTFKFTK